MNPKIVIFYVKLKTLYWWSLTKVFYFKGVKVNLRRMKKNIKIIAKLRE